MKIEFWVTGKTANKNIQQEVEKYLKKIKHYIPLIFTELTPPKPRSADLLVITESDYVLTRLNKDDYLILLDEQGEMKSSKEFASWLNKLFSSINNRIIFLSGGPYGFSKKLLERANMTLSLSKMTFTHDLVRMVFMEQLYRAMTILNNHPYQH
jgi:23S rRNA (pseudouridine1915-N3)-methyltransferase